MGQDIEKMLTTPKGAFTSNMDLINWIVYNYIS